jgi:hypothetical protein
MADPAVDVIVVTEDTALLGEHQRLRQERRRQQQQQQHRREESQDFFPFGSLGSIEDFQEQLEEIVHDVITFEPTDPEILLREIEEHNQERASDRGEMPAIPEEVLEELQEEGNIEFVNPTERSHSLHDELTFPEQQQIESHYTPSPDKLGCIPLAVLVFYNVSGGPFGIETAVRAGGNFYALLGFLVMPFVWSLQEALMTAELGTTFVEASGGVAWVEEAFGPSAGWISGYLGWIAGATGTNRPTTSSLGCEWGTFKRRRLTSDCFFDFLPFFVQQIMRFIPSSF